MVGKRMSSTSDPAAQARALVDTLGPETLAKAAAYTMGNHWLMLLGLLVTLVATVIVVRSRLLDRLSDRLNGGRPRPALTAFLVSAATLLVFGLLTLPWDAWTGHFREHSYGRTSQPFGDWLGQTGISLLIFAIVAGLFFMGVYALIRRAGRSWWIWSGGLVAAAVSAMLLLSPMMNWNTRAGEREADLYSLKTVNLPDALATALVKTAEYRDPRPTPLQEALFYTHPSVEKRVQATMEWKAAHPPG